MRELVAELVQVFADLRQLHRPELWSRAGGGYRCAECLHRWPCKTWGILARGTETNDPAQPALIEDEEVRGHG